MLLSKMTWEQVAAYLENDDRIIIPVGSTEQHGPRAVIGTDFLIPDAIAAEVARPLDDSAREQTAKNPR